MRKGSLSNLVSYCPGPGTSHNRAAEPLFHAEVGLTEIAMFDPNGRILPFENLEGVLGPSTQPNQALTTSQASLESSLALKKKDDEKRES
jgi:hypothetical protein